MNPIGEASAIARINQRWCARSRRRHASHPAQTATTARYVPSATISWKERCTAGTFGQSSCGTASSPCTRALGSWNASSDSPRGISRAKRVSRRATSGQPPSESGAPCSVRNSASAAASFTGSRRPRGRAKMRPRRDAIPPIQVDAQEDRFRKEREPFERERHADDRPGEPHEPRPQESELERQYRPRDGADREENGGAPRPALREV